MNEFEKLRDMLQIAHSKLFYVYGYFVIQESLQKLRAPNIIGKDKAKKNTKIMNNYNNFFVPVENSLRITYLIELTKFFDFDKDAVSISKIINYARSNMNKLTVREFEYYNKNRKYLSELIKDYDGITNDFLKDCERRLLEKGVDIQNKCIVSDSCIYRLNRLRNQSLAHEQFVKDLDKISVKEIKELFEMVAEIINGISKLLNHEETWHDHESDIIKDEVELLIEKLE